MVERQVVVHHPSRVEPSFDRPTNTKPVEVAGVMNGIDRFVDGGHQNTR